MNTTPLVAAPVLAFPAAGCRGPASQWLSEAQVVHHQTLVTSFEIEATPRSAVNAQSRVVTTRNTARPTG